MSESVALPSVLAELDERLRAPADATDLRQVLRGLQRLRLSEADLCIHIERFRAHNDATVQDEEVEENCLRALDLVSGYSVDGLKWDAATMAPVLLGAVLDRDALDAGCSHAVRPNDLLPRRPYDKLPEKFSAGLVEWVEKCLHCDDYAVTPADIFRTPKSAFTTRPAALLALPDRLAFEALAEMISERLGQSLPESVLWPRGRAGSHADGAGMSYRSRPLEWESKYIVKADIADFYGSVDHTVLGLITSTYLSMPRTYGQAVESLLSASMAVERGLPQGVPASDLFASAFLLPIDWSLNELKTTYLRYADDYLFPASSMDEARAVLQGLEESLRGIGLALNDDKTKIMRVSTYEKGLMEPANALDDLIKELEASQDIEFRHAETNERLVRQVEIEDEEGSTWTDILDPLWDQLYLGDLIFDDISEDIREIVQPELVEAHKTLLRALVLELPSGGLAERDAEILGRRCIALLHASRTAIDLDDVDTLLQWFPRLTPHVSEYIGAISTESQDEVASLLIRWLDMPQRSDWTCGWLCAAAQSDGFKLSDDLARRLESVAASQHEGMLTRTSAVRALAVAGQLNKGTWCRLFEDATSAVKSEMIFAMIFEPSRYPWKIETAMLNPSPSEK